MLSASFAPLPREVTAARHFALAAVEQLGCNPRDLAIVVTELASNACRHAQTPFTVCLDREGDDVVVEVLDGDPTSPASLRSGPEADSGRGVHIVEALAKAWGTRRCGTGKSVWVVLDC